MIHDPYFLQGKGGSCTVVPLQWFSSSLDIVMKWWANHQMWRSHCLGPIEIDKLWINRDPHGRLLEFWWTEFGENSHSLKPGEPATLVCSSCRTCCRTLFFLGGLVHCCACGHSDCHGENQRQQLINWHAINNCKELASCLLKLLSPKLLLLMYLCIFVYFAAPFGVRRFVGALKCGAIAEVMNKFIRSPLIRWCPGFGDQKTPNHLKHRQKPWKIGVW